MKKGKCRLQKCIGVVLLSLAVLLVLLPMGAFAEGESLSGQEPDQVMEPENQAPVPAGEEQILCQVDFRVENHEDIVLESVQAEAGALLDKDAILAQVQALVPNGENTRWDWKLESGEAFDGIIPAGQQNLSLVIFAQEIAQEAEADKEVLRSWYFVNEQGIQLCPPTALEPLTVSQGEPVELPATLQNKPVTWYNTTGGGKVKVEDAAAEIKEEGPQTYVAEAMGVFQITYLVMKADGTTEPALIPGPQPPQQVAYGQPIGVTPQEPANNENRKDFWGWALEGYKSNYAFETRKITADTTIIAYWDGPPASGEAVEITKEVLLGLSPQITLDTNPIETDTSGKTNYGMGYVGGAVTMALDGELKDVVFKLRMTTDDPDYATGQARFIASTSNLSGYTSVLSEEDSVIEVKVASIKPEKGSAEAQIYLAFLYAVHANISPNDMTVHIALEEVRCGDVTIGPEDWTVRDGEEYIYKWQGNTQRDLIAKSRHAWRIGLDGNKNFGGYNLNFGGTITPAFNTLNGMREFTPDAARRPKITLGAKTDYASLNTVDATSLQLEAEVRPVAEAGTLKATTFSGALLALEDWTQVFGQSMTGEQAEFAQNNFAPYFSISGISPDKWDAYIRYDSQAEVLRFRFVCFDTGFGTAEPLKQARPEITVNTLVFSQDIGNNAVQGRYIFAYVCGEEHSFTTYPQMVEGVKTQKVAALPLVMDTQSITLSLAAPQVQQANVTSLLSAYKKNVLAWKFNQDGYPPAQQADWKDQPGTDGNGVRNYISDTPLGIGATANAIRTDRVWFSHSLPSSYFSPLIDEIVISEKGGGRTAEQKNTPSQEAGWDDSQLEVLAFRLPTVGDGTLFNLSINGGAIQIVGDKNGPIQELCQGYDSIAYGEISGLGKIIDMQGAAVTNYAVHFTKDTRDKTPEQISSLIIRNTAATQVLFQLAPGFTAPGSQLLYNNSYALVRYQEVVVNGSSLDFVAREKATESRSSIPYKPVYEEYKLNKTAVNLDHAQTNFSGQFAPGNRVRFTVTFTVPEENSYGYVDNLVLRDSANENLVFDKDSLNCTVTIRTSYGSTAKLTARNMEGSKKVPILRRDGQDGYTAHQAGGTDMFYYFEGRLVKGDSITITYEGKTADTLQPGQNISNHVDYLSWFDGTGTYPGPWPWDPGFGEGRWTDGKSEYKAKIENPLAFGDVSIDFVEENATEIISSFLPGAENSALVTGGLVFSDVDLYSPSYLVRLPQNMQLQPAAGAAQITQVKKYNMALDGGGRRVLEYIPSDAASVTVQPIESGGVTYLYVTFTGAKLNKESNQGFGFQIPLRAKETTDKFNTNFVSAVRLGGLDKEAKPLALYQGNQGRGSSNAMQNWKTFSSRDADAVNGNASYFGGVSQAATGVVCTGAYRYVQVNSNATILSMTKNQSAPAQKYILGQDVNYTLQIKRSQNDNLGVRWAADIQPYALYQLVEILPPGQRYKEGSLTVQTANNGTAPVPAYTVEVLGQAGKDTVTVNGEECQRLLISFDTPLLLQYPAVLYRPAQVNVTYAATIQSLECLRGNYFDTFSALTSLYYYENDVQVSVSSGSTSWSSKKELYSDSLSAQDMVWWPQGGIAFPPAAYYAAQENGQPKELALTDIRRLEAGCTVQVKDQRIAPGIFKDKVGDLGEIANAGGADVEWVLRISNGSKAEMALEQYYVADVLPYKMTYTAMSENGGPAPTWIYTNAQHQQVLIWQFDGADKIAPGQSKTLQYLSRADQKAFGAMLNSAFVIPASGYFTAAEIAAGQAQFAADRFDSLARTADQEVILGDKAQLAEVLERFDSLHGAKDSATINVNNTFNAKAYLSVSNGSQNTTSATAYNAIPVERGSSVTYSYVLQNASKNDMEPYEGIEFYDTLPWQGDYYMFQSRPRASGWNLDMQYGTMKLYKQDRSNVRTEVPFTLYFSDTVPKPNYYGVSDLSHWYEDGTEWNQAENPAPKAFRVDVDPSVTLTRGEQLELEWKMTVPDVRASQSNTKAFNSAVFKFNRGKGLSKVFFAAEPEKVGIYLEGLDRKVQLGVTKQLSDYRLAKGEEKTFTFRLNQWSGDKYMPVDLFAVQIEPAGALRPLDPSLPENAGKFTLTAGNDQVSQAGFFTQLPEGKYMVEELDVDQTPGYTVTGSGVEIELGLLPGGIFKESTAILIQNKIEKPVDPPVDPSSSSVPSSLQVPSSSSDPAGSSDPSGSSGSSSASQPPSSSSGGSGPVTPPPPGPEPEPGPGSTRPRPAPLVPPPFIPEALAQAGGTTPPAPVIAPAALPQAETEADPEIETDLLGDNRTPRAQLDQEHWSVLNIMSVLFCTITSLLMIGSLLVRRSKEGRQSARKNLLWPILSGIIAAVSIVFFLVTEDISGVMVLVCEWTPLLMGLSAGQILVILGLRHARRKSTKEVN